MSEPVSTIGAQLSSLSDQVAAGATYHGVTVHLYTNPVTPAHNSILTDFTQATYGGYLPQGVDAWGLPFRDVDGVIRIAAEDLQFQPTDSVTPETIYGAYITSGSPPVLLSAERFDTPVPFNTPADGLLYTPRVNYGQ